MKVNHGKTQLLCVSASKSANVTSYVKSGSTKVESCDKLKMLGFMFGKDPSVQTHVNFMLEKARKKLWLLRHLKRAGLEVDDMLKLFNTIIRPTVEFAAPTYHPMLNVKMTKEIEGIQKRASKIIFGWDSSYADLIEDGRLKSLEERREELTVKFAIKSEKNPRFREWFPLKAQNELNLRSENKFEEFFTRNERMKKSPLFYMRRALNQIEKEEKRP